MTFKKEFYDISSLFNQLTVDISYLILNQLKRYYKMNPYRLHTIDIIKCHERNGLIKNNKMFTILFNNDWDKSRQYYHNSNCNKYNYNLALVATSIYNNILVIKYLINKGADDYETALYRSLSEGSEEISNYLITNFNTYYSTNLILATAVAGMKITYIKKYINKSNIKEYSLFLGALKGNHKSLINYLIPKVKPYRVMFIDNTQKLDYKYIINQFYSLGYKSYNLYLIKAARSSLEITKYLISMGADNLYQAHYTAMEAGKLEIVKYLYNLLKKRGYPINYYIYADYVMKSGNIPTIKNYLSIIDNELPNMDSIKDYLLELAVKDNLLNVIKFLIKEGANYQVAIKELSKKDDKKIHKYLTKRIMYLI